MFAFGVIASFVLSLVSAVDHVLLGGVYEKLMGDFKSQPESVVKHAVAYALRTVGDKEGLPLHDRTCARDYGQVCPQGWADEGDGVTCIVPAGYMGACSSKVRFGDLAVPLEKSVLAQECGATYPCIQKAVRSPHVKEGVVVAMDKCVSDFAQICPSKWTLKQPHCQAPQDYNGECAYVMDFTKFSAEQKEAYSKVCLVDWPCLDQ